MVAYLQAAGSSLIAFEKSTSSLASGSAPSPAVCKQILTGLSGDSHPVNGQSVANGVPNPVLRFEFTQDIQNKGEALVNCANGHLTPQLLNQVHQSASKVRRLLTQLGISGF